MPAKGPRSKRSAVQYAFDDVEGTDLLLAYIVGMALKGGAVRVGLTRDGGALAIGLYLGEDYGTEYIRPNENLQEGLREIGLAWDVWPATYDDEAGQWIAR